MYTIKQVEGVKNYGARNGKKPCVIVNHISMGTMSSMTNWFKNKESQVSSHFAIGRDGTIVQYVRIEDKAWTQGITLDKVKYATAKVVRDKGINPNWYCVSIEHEGYEGHGEHGELTDAQFYSSCWLHRYIMDYVDRKFNVKMGLNEYDVIGHFQVDPKRKPFCPGNHFPWERLRKELAIAKTMSLKEYTSRLDYLQNESSSNEIIVKFVSQVNDKYNKINNPQFAEAARSDLLALAKIAQKENFIH